MKDVVIGTLSGVSAVIAMSLLTPRPHPVPPPVRELAPADVHYSSDLGQEYLPKMHPDPTRLKLEHTTARVSGKEMRFDKLVANLSGLTGINFHVEWRSLEAAGINSDATITIDLQGVPASAVLKTALTDLGAGRVSLGYRAAGGVVRISTADELAKDAPTRIYNVRDIIEQGMLKSRRETRLSEPPSTPNEPGVRAGGTELTAEEAADALIRLIQEAIDPASWRDAGGATGGIRAFAGRLIVTQTPENHEMILGLLSALRRSELPPTTQGATR